MHICKKQTGKCECGAINYFAFARNEDGKVEQLFVHRKNGQMSQAWTGKVYKNQRAALADMRKINF